MMKFDNDNGVADGDGVGNFPRINLPWHRICLLAIIILEQWANFHWNYYWCWFDFEFKRAQTHTKKWQTLFRLSCMKHLEIKLIFAAHRKIHKNVINSRIWWWINMNYRFVFSSNTAIANAFKHRTPVSTAITFDSMNYEFVMKLQLEMNTNECIPSNRKW